MTTTRALAVSVAAVLVLASHGAHVGAQEAAARMVPAPAADKDAVSGSSATAVLAGGCFWGVQGVFQHVKGVTRAVSGYAGGQKETAQYERVGTGRTGHAEAVEITYDPRVISYGQLLQIFFSVAHDPTQLNRQGPDEGPQYRSAIFPQSAEQAAVAKVYIEQITKARTFARPIATKIEPGAAFYPAEPYHQDFLTRHPDHPYIVINDLPKVKDLQQLFPDVYRSQPVLVGSKSPAR